MTILKLFSNAVRKLVALKGCQKGNDTDAVKETFTNTCFLGQTVCLYASNTYSPKRLYSTKFEGKMHWRCRKPEDDYRMTSHIFSKKPKHSSLKVEAERNPCGCCLYLIFLSYWNHHNFWWFSQNWLRLYNKWLTSEINAKVVSTAIFQEASSSTLDVKCFVNFLFNIHVSLMFSAFFTAFSDDNDKVLIREDGHS